MSKKTRLQARVKRIDDRFIKRGGQTDMDITEHERRINKLAEKGGFKSPFMAKSPLNEIKLKKRGRVAHENFSGEGLQAKNTEQQTSTGVGINVEDRDWETKDVKDPSGVLNRPMTTREHNKGYRVKREKDGSVTLKGRRGN